MARSSILAVGCFLAIGAVALAQDAGKPAEGTLKGTVTAEDTKAPIADALIRVALPAGDMRGLRQEAVLGYTFFEARTDKTGAFEIHVPVTAEGSEVSVDAFAPGFGSLWCTYVQGNPLQVVIKRGEKQEVSLRLARARWVTGQVLDDELRPLANVEVRARSRSARGYRDVDALRTGKDGKFTVYDFPLEARRTVKGNEKGELEFNDPRFERAIVEDVYVLTEAQNHAHKIILRKGRKISGHVVSSTGKPVQDVLVEATTDTDRRAAPTDQLGAFLIEGLPVDKECKLVVHAKRLKEKSRRTLKLDRDYDLAITLEPVVLKEAPKTVKLLGMTLAPVNEELRDVYDLYDAHGVLILDPGADHARLGIGDLEEGDSFWLVGNDDSIETVEELARALLEGPPDRIRVVYSFRRLWFQGTSTQYARLTEADREELKTFLSRCKDAPGTGSRTRHSRKEDDSKKGTKLPFNPFNDCKEGDWECLLMKRTASEWKGTNQLVVVHRIAKVSGDAVEVAPLEVRARGVAETEPQHSKVAFSKKETPTVEALFDIMTGDDDLFEGKLTGIKVEDEKKTVGGREFACKKLTFSWITKFVYTNGDSAGSTSYVVWLASDVKGRGIVAMTLDEKCTQPGEPEHTLRMELELLGMGGAGGVDWGKKAEDAAAGLPEEKPAPEDQPPKDAPK
jgi:hypothetical protein